MKLCICIILPEKICKIMPRNKKSCTFCFYFSLLIKSISKFNYYQIKTALITRKSNDLNKEFC